MLAYKRDVSSMLCSLQCLKVKGCDAVNSEYTFLFQLSLMLLSGQSHFGPIVRVLLAGAMLAD